MSPTTITQHDWPTRLLNVLQQQHVLVERLAGLAETQGDLIREQKTDALLNLLSERQQIIDRFLAMQQDIGHLTQDLDERLEEVELPIRNAIQKLIDDIGQSLDVVMKHDERDRGVLQSSRNETKQELSGLGAASRARQAYLGASQSGARFADQQG